MMPPWANLDDDADLDLVVVNYGQNNYVYLNDGNGSFPQSTPFGDTADDAFSVDAGDLNGDGFDDIAVATTDNLQRAYFALNDGTGDFLAPVSISSRGDHRAVRFVDAEGDGDLDIALTMRYHDRNVLHLNDGTAAFRDRRQFFTTQDANVFSMDWADADGDGDLDIAAGDNGYANRIVWNRQQTLPTTIQTPITYTGSYPSRARNPCTGPGKSTITPAWAVCGQIPCAISRAPMV